MPPSHAITIWLASDETIMIRYPDGQQIPIPAFEATRLLAIIRHQHALTKCRPETVNWRENFRDAFIAHEADVRARGTEIRAKEEARKERETKRLARKVDKRQAKAEAEKLLAMVGL